MIIAVKYLFQYILERTRPGKKGTLAGTILKKYKDIRLSNPNNDKLLQCSF